MTTTEPRMRILVWDLPTRLFHWLLAGSFAGAYLTAESETFRGVHLTLGFIMFGLIAFRLFWGVAGSRYARFSSFPLRPAAVVAYLKSLVAGRPEHHVGHNPAGSYAVLALLALALVTTVSGYATWQELLDDELHEAVANTMLVLVGIHVAAVLMSSRLHGENLVRAMVTGYKNGRTEDGIKGGRWWALGTALVAAAVAGSATLAQAVPDQAATVAKAGGKHGGHAGRHHDHDEDDD